jgi:hypothetical protein
MPGYFVSLCTSEGEKLFLRKLKNIGTAQTELEFVNLLRSPEIDSHLAE